LTPGGLWDSSKYEIKAFVKHNGAIIKTAPLVFAGSPSAFTGATSVSKSGTYEVIVYVYDPLTGNTGVDKVKVEVN
jgi:hypothetical protein